MGVRKFAEHSENPFVIPDVKLKVIVSKARSDSFTNKSTGEVFDLVTDAKQYIDYHDSARYVKVFSGSATIIADLGIRGVAMLCYIIENVKPGKDTIELARKIITRDNRYTTLRGGGYYVGITDLLSHGVIARVQNMPEHFYVNTNVLFNGDRKRIVKDKIKQTEDATTTE